MHFDSDKLAFQRTAFGSQSLAAGAHSVASSFDLEGIASVPF